MGESYVECLVTKKKSFMMTVLMIFFVLIAIVAFSSVMIFGFVGMIATAIAGFLAYLIWMNRQVEYEYLYLDKELTVDKILAQTRRKKVATYLVSRMEIVAPINSYHLDGFKNRQVKTKDFSIGAEQQPDMRYVIFYEGGEKLIISPNEALIKALKTIAPRKVFTD